MSEFSQAFEQSPSAQEAQANILAFGSEHAPEADNSAASDGGQIVDQGGDYQQLTPADEDYAEAQSQLTQQFLEREGLGEQEAETPEESEPFEMAAPEEQQAEMQNWAAFQALPDAERDNMAASCLNQAYAEAQQSIDPKEAFTFTQRIGAESGAPGLENEVDYMQFATLCQVGSENLERTLRSHPGSPAFLAAVGKLSDLSPEQRQSPYGQRMIEAALQAAIPVTNETVAKRMAIDVSHVFHNPDLLNVDPVALLAECSVALAMFYGWGRGGVRASRGGQDRQQAHGAVPEMTTHLDIFGGYDSGRL